MEYLVRKDTGTRLAFEIKPSNKSNAETIVLIHGLSFDRHIWNSITDPLQEDYHIVTYDLCGHGDSDCIEQPLTWDFLCQSVLYVLDHLSIDFCHLIGHGFGGIVAMKSANQFTDRIRSLTLVSTPLYFPEDIFKYEYESRIHLLENNYEAFIERLVKAEVNSPIDEKKYMIENAIRKVDSATYRDGIRLVFGDAFSLMEELTDIQVPTLLMSGDRNTVFPPHYMALYASVVPMSRVQIIPNASNAVFIDHPTLFIDAVKDFLSTHHLVSQTPSHAFLMKKMRNILENAYKEEVGTPILEVISLRKFSVKWKGRPLVGKWTQRSAKELLLYLSLWKSVSRERLIEAFFTEADVHKAKNYLRVMLNHLKTIFEGTGDSELVDSLQVTRSSVNLKCTVSSDLTRFLNALKDGFHEDRTMFDMKFEFLHLLNRYHDGFLAGFHAPWVGEVRNFIENRFSDALIKLVGWFEERGMDEDALQILRESRSIEVYDGYCDEKIEELITKKETLAARDVSG